jgi:hypothetical protein
MMPGVAQSARMTSFDLLVSIPHSCGVTIHASLLRHGGRVGKHKHIRTALFLPRGRGSTPGQEQGCYYQNYC